MPNIDNLNEMVERALREKPIEKPAGRWRNWWRVRFPTKLVCLVCGNQSARDPSHGDIPAHCQTWPSKDVAETKAMEFVKAKDRSHLIYVEAREEKA